MQRSRPETHRDVVLERIVRHGVVAISRGSQPPEHVLPAVEILLAGGVRIVEVTMNSAYAEASLAALRERFRDDLLIGAGTVMSGAEATTAIELGATFLVSPHLGEDVAHVAREHGVPYLPGVYTPTEVVRAMSLGCDVVKLFPAEAVGPAYLKALRGPLPGLRVMATGGITPETATAWAAGGAVAVGVGTSLLRDEAIDQRSGAALRERTEALVRAWQEGRR